MESRFKDLAESLGFQVVPTACFVNGKFTRRPDIQSVQYHGKHIMTAPTKIYGFPVETHLDITNRTHPDYFDLEYRLLSWNKLIKETNYLKEEDEKLYNSLKA